MVGQSVKKPPNKPKIGKMPAFALRAERALSRAANNVRARNRAASLPLIVWREGKVVEETA